MGTLERLRKTSPYVLAAFAIIFVGFMVASDADISNLLKQGTNYQTAAIGEVNGEKILYKDFETKVKEAIDQQKSQTKEGEDMSVDEVQVRRQIWQQMVDDILLKQQAEKMGIFVSRDEVLDVLLDNPPDYLRKPFTDSLGRFQKESYLEIVTNPEVILNRLPQSMSMEEKKNVVASFRNDLMKIQKYLLEEKLSESMRACVNAAGTFLSPNYVKQKYINDNSFADFSYVQLDVHQVPDKAVTVSDQEIEKYYENVSKYNKSKAKRKIKFVLFQLAPSDKDTAQALKAIKKITTEILAAKAIPSGNADSVFSKKMKEFQGQVVNYTLITDIQQNLMNYLTNMAPKEVAGPIQLPDGTYFLRLDDKRTGDNEVVKASHILIPFGTNKDSAKAEAQKIMEKAKKGDFAELAKEYSTDKGSAMNGGDLGYFGKGKMVKPFEEAAFAAKTGSVVGPVESQFGFHIIKVTDKKSEEIKYSMIKISVETSRATIKALARNAKEIKTKVENGQSFDEAAKFFLKTPRETDFFDMEKPILSSNYLTSLAFETEVGKIIEPIELKGYGFVVAQVIDSREAGLVPLKDMKDKIKSILIKSKKLDALKANAETAFNAVKNAGQLTAAGAQFAVKTATNISNNGMVTGIGQDFALTEYAMTAPSGVISGPYRCETGWYIIQVTNRKVPDAATVSSNIPGFTNQLKTTTSQTTYYQWLQQVHEDADIKDFRAKFFKEY